jgi:hypothetical protein
MPVAIPHLVEDSLVMGFNLAMTCDLLGLALLGAVALDVDAVSSLVRFRRIRLFLLRLGSGTQLFHVVAEHLLQLSLAIRQS